MCYNFLECFSECLTGFYPSALFFYTHPAIITANAYSVITSAIL
nr:MAG TPA: hypothetical protein [Caudoviricetes sp.]